MNIPFELIFIVLFFVLPAISSVVRRVQRRGQPRPPTRTRPTRTDTSGPEASAETSADTRTDVPRWLEEAQRRVREAQQGESDGRGSRGTQATSSSPPQPQAARPLVQPHPSAPRPNQTRSATARPKPTSYEDYRSNPVSLERTSASTRQPATTPAPPLRVQRLGAQRGAKLGSYKMRFDEQTLMTGFIWHQILSEPLSKSRRNSQSQRQR